MADGRPTDYTDEIADTICLRLSEGESLNKICFDDGMPCKATVYNWLANEKHRDFLDKYTRARERQAETFVDECLDIADMSDFDTKTKTTKGGDNYEVPNHEWISRSKLRVETRLKLAEKLAPRKYKPQSGVEVSGHIKSTDVDVKKLSKEEMVKAYQDAIRS